MQNAPERVCVNIVSWNSFVYLPALFSSLDEQTVSFRTIVVDNASTDESIRWLTGERPQVTVLRNMRNQGFAKAHNQGITLALNTWKDTDLNSCYIVICNPDIEMDPGCLAQLQQFMDDHPDVDACMPKLRRAHLRMTETEHVKTQRTDLLDATGMILTKSRRAYDRGSGEPDENQYDEELEIFGVCGALCLYRASSIIGAKEGEQFYDEDFFAYQEDIDAAWRLKRLAMKSVYVPKALAWHHRAAPSATGGGWVKAFVNRFKKPAHINYLSTRNHAWLLAKHLSPADIVIHGFWILPYELAKLFASIFSLSSLKGYFAAFWGLPKMWKKRKKLKLKEKVPPGGMRGEFV
ncbi:glycosyltransferase [Candidatus Uhrbacteria bacterium]|nr:glycosyltransferase [Candidatus Uhrbacteria bacterium]